MCGHGFACCMRAESAKKRGDVFAVLPFTVASRVSVALVALARSNAS